jgi:hypothetical protein
LVKNLPLVVATRKCNLKAFTNLASKINPKNIYQELDTYALMHLHRPALGEEVVCLIIHMDKKLGILKILEQEIS